jgi:hypothetical protein
MTNPDLSRARAGIYPEQSDTRLAEKANYDRDHYELLDSQQFIYNYVAEAFFHKDLSRKADVAACIGMLSSIDTALMELQVDRQDQP